MSIKARAVRVHQVPERTTFSGERIFLEDVRKYGQSQRPRLVLDCSKLQYLDTSTLRLLLCCLEEVMKCNGDVRLASLCPEATAALRIAGVGWLFEAYSTPEAAVNSFHLRSNSMALCLTKDEDASHLSERAA